jgi:hypothetical protein
MATKGLICAVAVCSGLLGCATPKFLPPVNCKGGSCDVDVHVENCTVTAPKIDNYGANNIFWTLDRESREAGYKFPDEAVHLGVWLKSPPPIECIPADGVFDSPQRLNDWKFKLHNKGTPGTYCYGVTVVKGSTTCPPLDPSIVNH